MLAARTIEGDGMVNNEREYVGRERKKALLWIRGTDNLWINRLSTIPTKKGFNKEKVVGQIINQIAT